MNDYDAIVIGGGHNGLTAAAYLGKGGMRTLVLERRGIVGGAAVTEEFHPGYRNSIASYVVSLLRPEIIADLELVRHGLELLRFDGVMHACGDRHLHLTGDAAHDQSEFARFSNRDYHAVQRFKTMLLEIGDVIREQILREPPNLGGGFLDILSAIKLGRDIKGLSDSMRQHLVRMFTSSAADIIERWFESDMIRSVYASGCVSGNFTSLNHPGSAIPFLIHGLGELEGERGVWGTPRGGMGAITQAMAASAREHGVELRTDAPVERILVEAGRAHGVRLESGEQIRARTVLANTDPKRTFLRLVGREHLDPEFAADIESIRMGHASLRMNLALGGLPRTVFSNEPGVTSFHRSKLYVFPPMAELEASYHRAVAGHLPESPRIDIMLPSTLDSTLAPPGHHVMSLLCKYYPYDLAGGLSWDDVKDSVADRIVDHAARYYPDLRELIVGRQVLTPLDLERVFGLTGGDIFHGRHDLDQIFSMRPHPSSAQYRTPIEGLYLCGSGAHPGGAVSGAPGYNCARRVLKDRRR